MIAQCQLKLGELGLEVENYSQAIEDFNECLSIHEVSSITLNVATLELGFF